MSAKRRKIFERLAVNRPNRYLKDKTGWRCPPGEAAAAALGFSGYKVVLSRDINPIFFRNLKYLDGYDQADISHSKAEEIRAIIESRPGRTLTELLAEGVDHDDLMTVLAKGMIHGNLRGKPLVDQDEARFYPDLESVHFYERAFDEKPQRQDLWMYIHPLLEFSWDGKRCVVADHSNGLIKVLPEGRKGLVLTEDQFMQLVDEGTIVLDPAEESESNGDRAREEAALERFNSAGKKAKRRALRKQEEVESPETYKGKKHCVKTLYNWRKAREKALEDYGNENLGYLPHPRGRTVGLIFTPGEPDPEDKQGILTREISPPAP